MNDEQKEQRIAEGLRAGSADAWRALYDSHAERVWRCVARMLGSSSSDVADVVQETFLAAARSARTFDAERGTLWLWLWGIARRQVALHFRKHERQTQLRIAGAWLANGNGQLLRRLEQGQEAPHDVIESAELATLVRATLAELPGDYEALLTAKYLDGTPVEQIAETEHSTILAVRSKLARARQAFRQAFGKYAELFTAASVRGHHESTGR